MKSPLRRAGRAARAIALVAGLAALTACGPGPYYVHFDTGMEVPKAAEDRAAIDEAARTLEAHPELHAAVIGHTDDTGNEAINRQLSARRARVVRDALVAAKIAPARLVVAARSDLDPATKNDSDEGRAKNRRTEIFLFDPRRGELSKQYGAKLEVDVRVR
jgi:hypothetical protein